MLSQSQVKVIRRPDKFHSDDARVITRFFVIGGEHRIHSLIARILPLNEPEVKILLQQTFDQFADRHKDIKSAFRRHFGYVRQYLDHPDEISENKQLLIGSYFTMEYSIESAALFNPSIVLHPDQSGMLPHEARFIMSLRATGEGHVSSIVFRTGKICCDGHVEFDPPGRFTSKLRTNEDQTFQKHLFFLKLIEMAAYSDTARVILDELPDYFTLHHLDQKISEVRTRHDRPEPFDETAENMHWLARSNYHLFVPPETDPSEIVIFPTSENESRGIEDVRLTRFIDDDGTLTYYGTYTAYNGYRILPQLLETHNFTDISIHTLNGKYVQNKGMALFPRRIDGFYHMISRLDGENMFLMKSDNVHFWNEAVKLQTPRYPWEFVQIGNCGPPIETAEGWLLLTHGVGPMRRYCIGASLLDLENPSKIIAHTPQPIMVPADNERDGYVPNVVYSCGALVHDNHLIVPYAMSDSASSVATIKLSELLSYMRQSSPLCPLPNNGEFEHHDSDTQL
ncbi:Beta-1,4-mannooligosaccharide phosphorylase [Poriferisphaera corsica]|uniref:Beta-1,4-mannooligosaccharide phosphorylase n=1 Tax=Poriferisphaera corsica TaxID=2528020 RepID=A0A517YWZ5_9BACT|nr:glycoside hydrolase family 130 protein [Poriferisphaera corsica]QDU34727.1 Beta-1,4-mannooligosaccharide phosphorylase [Poriferisphaera corsica]